MVIFHKKTARRRIENSEDCSPVLKKSATSPIDGHCPRLAAQIFWIAATLGPRNAVGIAARFAAAVGHIATRQLRRGINGKAFRRSTAPKSGRAWLVYVRNSLQTTWSIAAIDGHEMGEIVHPLLCRIVRPAFCHCWLAGTEFGKCNGTCG